MHSIRLKKDIKDFGKFDMMTCNQYNMNPNICAKDKVTQICAINHYKILLKKFW